jgi:hypothetical protein
VIKCLSRKELNDLVSQNIAQFRSEVKAGLTSSVGAEGVIDFIKSARRRSQSYGRHCAHVQVVSHFREMDWESNLPALTIKGVGNGPSKEKGN